MGIGGLYFFSLRFFRIRVFDSYFLYQNLCGSVVQRAITFKTTNIQVLDHNIRF